jgi:hypothetical protein
MSAMSEQVPETPETETRGGERPDWEKARPGQPLPEKDGPADPDVLDALRSWRPGDPGVPLPRAAYVGQHRPQDGAS